MSDEEHQNLTVKEACRITRCSRPTLMDLLNDPDPEHRLPSLRIGTKILIPRANLEEWLKARVYEGPHPLRVKAGKAGQRAKHRQARSRRRKKAATA